MPIALVHSQSIRRHLTATVSITMVSGYNEIKQKETKDDHYLILKMISFVFYILSLSVARDNS